MTGSNLVTVARIPTCDICHVNKAAYDGKTIMGPWAFMCEADWQTYGVGKLGVGFGQRLMKGD